MALADVNPKPADFMEEYASKRAGVYQITDEGGVITNDGMNVSDIIIFDETEDYLKSVGHWDAFDRMGAEKRLKEALDERYKRPGTKERTYAEHGAEVFDKIAGVYDIPKQGRANQHSLNIPQSVKCTLDKNIHDYNEKLVNEFEQQKKNAPKEAQKYYKTVPKIYLKEGDNDYIWTITKTGDEKVFKTIGKFLHGKDETALKSYREWKSMQKLATSENVKLVISTNPADIMRKSTRQWWESKSCERLGGGYESGIWHDIALNNAIAYVTVDDSPTWLGRVMLRWCEQGGEGGALGFGIEPLFYGEKVYEDVVKKKILELGEEHGLVDYYDEDVSYGSGEKYTCKTPYNYDGWSDQMRGSNKEIVYGSGGMAGIEEEIRQIVQEWTGVEGAVIPYGDWNDDVDNLSYLVMSTNDLGSHIDYEFGEFLGSFVGDDIQDVFPNGIPYDWEETVLRGYPHKFDFSKQHVDEVIMKTNWEYYSPSSPDDEPLIAFVLAYADGDYLKRVFKILRRTGMNIVIFEKPKDELWEEECKDTRGYRRGCENVKTGIYDMTHSDIISDECLDDEKCDVFDKLSESYEYREKKPKSWRKEKTTKNPFQYDEIWFYDIGFAQKVLGFYKCMREKDDTIVGRDEEKALAGACFMIHFEDLGRVEKTEEIMVERTPEEMEKIKDNPYHKGWGGFSRPKKTYVKNILSYEGGGTVSLGDIYEDSNEFVKKHPDINYDEFCNIIKNVEQRPSWIDSFCQISRPIEKFWEDTKYVEAF